MEVLFLEFRVFFLEGVRSVGEVSIFLFSVRVFLRFRFSLVFINFGYDLRKLF